MFQRPKPAREEPPEPKLPPPRDKLATERDKVVMWRTEVLFEAGYPHTYAYALAKDGVDLHRAVDLLRETGDLDLTLRILL